MYTMTACLLGAVLAQQQHSNDNRNSKPRAITVPERLYYCNVAQVTSGICTQLPFGTTTRSVAKAKQPLSLDECNLVCGGRGQDKSGGDSLASLWPLPTSRYSLGSPMVVRGTCPRQDWVFQFSGPGSSGASGQLLNDATKVLFGTLESQYGAVASCKAHGALGPILIQVHVQTTQATLQLHTDESYNLTFNLANKSPSKSPTIAITASTFFGARNAMETLSQLVGRPPAGSTAGLSIVQSATVSDAPAFTYRGIMPLTHSLTHSVVDSLTHSPTHPPTHSLTQSHSLTHPLTHPPTHPLTHTGASSHCVGVGRCGHGGGGAHGRAAVAPQQTRGEG